MTHQDVTAINAVVVAIFFIVAMIKIQLLSDKCDKLEKENTQFKNQLQANRLTRKLILNKNIRHNGRD